MAKINIYLLASHRSRVIEIQSYIFKRIRNKDKIKVYLMTTGHECYSWGCEPIYNQYAKELNDAGVETVINVTNGGGNYLQKINFAQTQDSEYSVKLDEDLWFNENVWDYMIDNCHSLDDPKNLTLGPVLSNGIPTCDMFCQDFLDPNEYEEIKGMIKNTHIPDMWGARYSHLNQATTAASEWNPHRYYELARKIKHHYKGIHPVRINYPLNRRINDFIVGKWEKLMRVPMDQLRIEAHKHPYLCNSVFMIKTDTWRKIIADRSLYRDDFDEVPLNLYREQNDLNWLFIRNGYCLHMIYNTVCQPQYEEQFTSYCLNLTRGLVG